MRKVAAPPPGVSKAFCSGKAEASDRDPSTKAEQPDPAPEELTRRPGSGSPGLCTEKTNIESPRGTALNLLQVSLSAGQQWEARHPRSCWVSK